MLFLKIKAERFNSWSPPPLTFLLLYGYNFKYNRIRFHTLRSVFPATRCVLPLPIPLGQGAPQRSRTSKKSSTLKPIRPALIVWTLTNFHNIYNFSQSTSLHSINLFVFYSKTGAEASVRFEKFLFVRKYGFKKEVFFMKKMVVCLLN
jgi:hypothetical protein